MFSLCIFHLKSLTHDFHFLNYTNMKEKTLNVPPVKETWRRRHMILFCAAMYLLYALAFFFLPSSSSVLYLNAVLEDVIYSNSQQSSIYLNAGPDGLPQHLIITLAQSKTLR